MVVMPSPWSAEIPSTVTREGSAERWSRTVSVVLPEGREYAPKWRKLEILGMLTKDGGIASAAASCGADGCG